MPSPRWLPVAVLLVAQASRVDGGSDPGDSICVAPQFMAGGQSLTLPDGHRLEAPATAFRGSVGEARAFLRAVHALPLRRPFARDHVELAAGWLYDTGRAHRAVDYWRSDVDAGDDPTFLVLAVAPGRVMATGWEDGGGNFVLVEHRTVDGQRYLTKYMHLRDGKAHDLALAQRVSCADVIDDRCERYQRFARRFADHPSWGIDAHALRVHAGDVVAAGEPLGYAGNTGYGGAGWGLDENGRPKQHRGQVHLHMYVGVEHPTRPGDYVLVDPYGVYASAASGCYARADATLFERLFAAL